MTLEELSTTMPNSAHILDVIFDKLNSEEGQKVTKEVFLEMWKAEKLNKENFENVKSKWPVFLYSMLYTEKEEVRKMIEEDVFNTLKEEAKNENQNQNHHRPQAR